MKRFFLLLVFLCICLSSCSQANRWKFHHEKKVASEVYKQIPADFIPKKFIVVSAGDSLTQGVGDLTKKGGYLSYLKTMLEKEKGIKEVTFYNFGVKGNRTTQLLDRLKSPKVKNTLTKADLVILTIGGNDIMKVVRENITHLQLSDFKKERDSYIRHLTQILEEIGKVNPKTSIVLVGLYNPFSDVFSNTNEIDEIIASWNQAGQTVIANYPNAYFVDIQDLFVNTKENLLSADHFHPNNKGYELIAGRLNQILGEQTLPDLEKKSYMASTEEN